MQLGVTISLARHRRPRRAGARPPVSTRVMASFLAVILALLIVTYLHVVIGELVPKGIALGHPERTALAVSTPVRAFFVVVPAADLAAAGVDERDPARCSGSSRPGAEHEAHSEAELRMLLSTLRRAGRDRARRAGDALQGLRLRRQGGLGRDGAAAGGGRDLDRAAAGGGAEGGARVAVHALSRSTASRSTTSSASCTSAT